LEKNKRKICSNKGVFQHPVSLSVEIDTRVTNEVQFEELPQAIQTAMKNSIDTIENRKFEETDYSAEVSGLYVIFESEFSRNVVAYAVVGFGSGEPDYNESLVYGFDLKGRLVYEDIQDW
jgi:hypothetical protein